MAYFIGNGSVTIGGGSLGRTEQLPSLKLLCVDLCSRHLDRLSDLGDIPTEVFIDLLKRAKEKATPELVKRFQDINERLWCEEVDTAFWKQAVEGHILRRTVPAPGPLMVSRVNDHKERLNALQAVMAPSSGGASTSSSTSSNSVAGKGQEDKEWSRDVSTVLQALENTPVSVGLLRETLIGKAVSPFRKSKDPKLAATAADLVRRWKEAAALAAATTAATEAKGSGGSGGGGGSNQRGGSGGGGGAAVGGERRPAEEKQRAVEEGFKCRTWESLYQHLEVLRAEKVRTSSKRAREAREREDQKRPKMIMGKSRGEDFTRKTGRISGKISAPSFFSGLSSSSSGPASLSPQRTPKKKPFANPSSSRRSGSSGSSGKGSGNRGAFGLGGGSSSSSSSSRSKGAGASEFSGAKKPKKADHYSSGVTSVAELRRKVVSDQRLSVPVQQLKKLGQGRAGSGGGGGSAGAAAAAAARSPPHKKSKFWK